MNSSCKVDKNLIDFVEFIYDINNDPILSHLYEIRIKRVSELLDDFDELNILSVGCGPAPMAREILGKKGVYFGVDISHQVLRQAKKKNEKNTLLLVEGNMICLPFENESIDLLLCLGALEYAEDVNFVIKEFSRVMKNDAIVIISMQNNISPYRFWDRKIYTKLNFLRKLFHRSTTKAPPEKLISLNNLRKLLFCHSLVVTDYLYYNFNILLRPLDRFFPLEFVMISERLENLHHSILGFIAADFIVKAQKV